MNCRLGRFVLIASLALSSTSFGAKAWAASPPATADHSVALSPELRAKMLKLISTMGRDREVPAPIASALGLTPAGTAWPDRQFAFQWNGVGTAHAIAIGHTGEQDIVLTVRGPAAIEIFRTRPDGTLKSAVNFFLQTSQAQPVASAEARSELTAELAFWAANIDAVLDQN
jgi:hypothetical protein